MSINRYCVNPLLPSRLLTREVKVGNLGIGGRNPVRIQSMTTSNTLDVKATIEESIRMIEAGCELVRITAPSLKEAMILKDIREGLNQQGYPTPICADIHFTPNAAEMAARLVQKVRVNPGNYADKKKFENFNYTEDAYRAELDRIEKRFSPLVKICKEYGTALRIGTNHGSLSDRILSRYGDTPLGMVESAMEFVRICEALNFHEIILSMKASNTRVMVQAYRLLVHTMMETGRNYPLHLGVTEAGDGEDGRIKSALGIGVLMADGLGDTIRVSLTEPPEFELPVAASIVKQYVNIPTNPQNVAGQTALTYNPFEYARRESIPVLNIGGTQVPVVFADLSGREEISTASLYPFGYHYQPATDKWIIRDQAADYIFCGKNAVEFHLPGTINLVYPYKIWNALRRPSQSYPLFTHEEFRNKADKSAILNFLLLEDGMALKNLDEKVVLVLELHHEQATASMRKLYLELSKAECKQPVVFRIKSAPMSNPDFLVVTSADAGAGFVDGMGDGIWIEAATGISASISNTAAFGILQAARCRSSKTEYISCPSCGRTLFDLQEVTSRIRSKTHHLKGIKIGIMGCIVNGPGEMADADYGYVGTGIGKVSLYKGQKLMLKNVPENDAVSELISLIKENGDWKELEIGT